MSNYTAPAIHPETGVEQMADWLPHYYGRRRGAVRFRDGKVFQADLVQVIESVICCNCIASLNRTTWKDAHDVGWRKFNVGASLEFTICPRCRTQEHIDEYIERSDEPLTD